MATGARGRARCRKDSVLTAMLGGYAVYDLRSIKQEAEVLSRCENVDRSLSYQLYFQNCGRVEDKWGKSLGAFGLVPDKR